MNKKIEKQNIDCMENGTLLDMEEKYVQNTKELNNVIAQIRYFQKTRFYNKHNEEFVEMINKEMEKLDERFKELVEL